MFENVQFFAFAFKVWKSATVIGPNFLKNNLEIKNAEFYDDYK